MAEISAWKYEFETKVAIQQTHQYDLGLKFYFISISYNDDDPGVDICTHKAQFWNFRGGEFEFDQNGDNSSMTTMKYMLNVILD